jgi:hypothetical protein
MIKRSIFLFSVLAAAVSACAPEKKDPAPSAVTVQQAADSNKVCTKPLNPNGDSELAVLMRRMTAFTDSLQKKITGGSPIGDYPKTFEHILTARPTDSAMNRAVFTGFANAYLEKLKRLYFTETSDRTVPYNNVVKSCITCHENFCQGPIKRIQKMLVKE